MRILNEGKKPKVIKKEVNSEPEIIENRFCESKK